MIIDILSLIFVTAFAYISMKKGAVGAAMRLAGIILSLFVSMLVYPVVTMAIYKTPIPETVSGAIEEVIIREGNAIDAAKAIDAMPDFLRKNMTEAIDMGARGAAKAVSGMATRTVINIVVFAALAAAVRVIILLLTGALRLSCKLPVIKQFNSLIGMLCGLSAAVVLLWIVSALLCAFAASNKALAVAVSESYVVRIMSLFAPF